METHDLNQRFAGAAIAFEHAPDLVLEIRGSERVEWLNALATADLATESAGAIRSLCLDRLGKILAEFLVWREPTRLVLVVTNGERARLVEHLERYIIMEDVELGLTDERFYSIHGRVEETSLRQLANQASARYSTAPWLTPTDYVALVPRELDSTFRQSLAQCEIPLRGQVSWDETRAEFGILAWGRDFGGNDTPVTAGLVDELVSRAKGCYLGQEVVCKTLMRGAVREQVVRLWFSQATEIGVDIVATQTGDRIGSVSSVGATTPDGTWAIGRVRQTAIIEQADITAGQASGKIRPRVSLNGEVTCTAS